MTTFRTFFSLTAVAAALSVGSTANAITYNASSGTAAPAGSSFVVVGGGLGLKSQAGFSFLGVTGGASGNEIDIGQSLTVKFTTPQIVTELVIGLLFDGPEYGDYREQAKVKVDPSFGPDKTYCLTAKGPTWATWTGVGSVVNLSPAIGGLGAVWKLVNPFGHVAVDSIKLYPNKDVAGSDFGLAGFSTRTCTAVPDTASTLSLLGLVVLGFALVRRRTA